jgi:hypothetical protein
MDEQYQEHLDYMAGVASEHQNALALSRLEHTDDSGKIAELVKAGRFVVVAHGPAYCRFTDAIYGVRKVYIADYATEAEANADPRYNDDDPDPEVNVLVYPLKPPAPLPVDLDLLPRGDDEIPF